MRCAVNFFTGADQTSALGTRLFTKPDGPAQATEQLRALAGRGHELHPAVAVARDGKILFESADTARMTMRRLGEGVISANLNEAGAAGPVTSRVTPTNGTRGHMIATGLTHALSKCRLT